MAKHVHLCSRGDEVREYVSHQLSSFPPRSSALFSASSGSRGGAAEHSMVQVGRRIAGTIIASGLGLLLLRAGEAFLGVPRPPLARRTGATAAGRRLLASVGDGGLAATQLQQIDVQRRRFEGLAAERFQHPVDQDATGALRRIPGLESLVRGLIPVVEETIYLDNIANSILVGPKQMPSVYNLLMQACEILDMDAPELYVRQNPTPNAYTLAVKGKKPFIVLHTSLIDLMDPKELQAVIAHELGHLKCEHGVWVTVGNILAQGMYRSGFGLGAWVADTIGVRRLLFQWLRAAEFTCDRAAMLVAQDVEVVVSTILKLVGGSVSQAQELSVPAFLEQARTYATASRSRVGRLVRDSQSEQLTHPLPVVRAQELEKFSRSPQYYSLLRRSRPLAALEAPEKSIIE